MSYEINKYGGWIVPAETILMDIRDRAADIALLASKLGVAGTVPYQYEALIQRIAKVLGEPA
jgi:hypothetical protein